MAGNADQTQADSDMRGKARILSKAHVFAIAAAFGYLIIRHSVSEGLSENFPEVSLLLNSRNPEAVLNFSQQLIIDEEQKQDDSEEGKRSQEDHKALDPALRQRVVGMLRVSPLNAHAYQLLGRLSELENRPDTTKRLMKIASKLSLHEPSALAFLMREGLQENDSKAVVGYADIMMRGSTSVIPHIAPLLAQLSELPAVRDELIKRLGDQPPWRESMLRAFASVRLNNARAPFDLFSALQESPSPISEKELSGYVSYLFKQRAYQFAYFTWAKFLPESDIGYRAHVFNGSFERKPSGLPFDWIIGNSREARVGVFARPDNGAQSALRVSFGQSRADFPPVREVLVLNPGVYRFKGIYQGELRARRGLQWSVTCIGGPRAGESDMLVGQIPAWRVFSFEITIPADQCPAQYLQLTHMARSPSEQLASGHLWFDEIEITRVGDLPSADEDLPQAEVAR